jgi:hypothetical protein
VPTPALNNIFTTLSGAIDSVVTSVPLVNASAFPLAGWAAIEGETAYINEVISWTGKSGNTLTGVTRGRDGTTAASHTAGKKIGITVIARHITELQVTHGTTAERMTLGLAYGVDETGRRFWDTDVQELFVWVGGDWGVPTISFGTHRGIRDYLISSEPERTLVLSENYRKGDRLTDLTSAVAMVYVCATSSITHTMNDWLPIGRQG